MKLKYTYEAGWILLIVILIGLFYSRFMISLGTVALCFLWLISASKKQMWMALLRNTLTVSAWMVFIVYLISFLNTANNPGYWAEIKNRLPYLFFPMTFILLPRITDWRRLIFLYVFIGLLVISSCWSFGYYIAHSKDITDAYAQGQIIPTVIHHVAYSYLLVTGVLLIIYMIVKATQLWVRILLMIILLWLIFIIHLLAIRTGIICLYVLLPIYLCSVFLVKKAYKMLIISIVAFIVLGVVLFFTTDTIQKKTAYVVYDLEQIRKNINNDNQLSDSRRLLSDKLGLEIAIKHPWAGVGIGDVKDEMNKLYIEKYPDFTPETRGHIHNQFIYVLAGCGFFLGIFFIINILIPLYYYFRYRHFLLGCLYLGLMLVLCWEPFLEYQVGNTIFLLILAWGINQTKNIID